jgi:hypothetical protein
MINETMTRTQRFLTAVTLGIPDRVPVSSMFDDFALRQKGISPAQRFDPVFRPQVLQAFHEIFDDLGGYDFQWHAGTSFAYSTWRGSADIRVNSVPPGQESSLKAEREALFFDDYAKIISRGWNGFCEEFYPRITRLSIEQIDANQRRSFAQDLEDLKWWSARGVPVHQGATCLSPEVILSLGRTLTNFVLDMHHDPDKIQAVLDAMLGDLIENAVQDAAATGIPWAHILLTRGSATVYNLKIFERFVFPYLKKMVDTFVSNGLMVNLHCDTNWLKNLPYFKELPKAKCIVELDSTSDIFKAKEILNGHMCIKGDVPAPLLSLGKPADVVAYCRKLIDVVGKGGGFVLSTGCTCPVDAKFENVKAMIDTAKSYSPS